MVSGNMSENRKAEIFGKRDVIVIVSLLLIAFLGFFAVKCFHGVAGETVIAELDGECVFSHALNEDAETVIHGKTCDNHIIIKNGEVYVSEAGCPDKICVDHRPISHGGESIVCLPNRLVIRIEGEPGETDGSVPDAVAR